MIPHVSPVSPTHRPYQCVVSGLCQDVHFHSLQVVLAYRGVHEFHLRQHRLHQLVQSPHMLQHGLHCDALELISASSGSASHLHQPADHPVPFSSCPGEVLHEGGERSQAYLYAVHALTLESTSARTLLIGRTGRRLAYRASSYFSIITLHLHVTCFTTPPVGRPTTTQGFHSRYEESRYEEKGIIKTYTSNHDYNMQTRLQ